MFPNRPKRGETEEDLLKQQEEFFKSQSKPSVKLVSAKSTQNKEEEKSCSKNENKEESRIYEHLSNTFEDIPKNLRLNKITERKQFNFNAHEKEQDRVMVSRSLHGFPKAKRRDLNEEKPIKGSIFARQMKKQRLETNSNANANFQGSSAFLGQLVIKERKEEDVNNKLIKEDLPLPDKSYIITGEDKEDLHKENIEKLCEMGEREILEEQQNLIETMDPALIAFLKSRRSNLLHEEELEAKNKMPSMVEQMRKGEEVKLEDLETPMEILQQPEAEKWLNFDTVESSKLAWMETVKQTTTSTLTSKEKPYEARFDFEGHILPYEQEITEKNRALFHHGEEPTRPGYTLTELFQLARSSINQQKIVALNTIANILQLDSLGIYQEIIPDLPYEQIFFVLRFCLDDNTPSVLNSSIKALRNLIYYTIDETCIDAIFTFNFNENLKQPCLACDSEEFEDDPTINDQQLAEKNLIKCLIRSDILTRIRYIINVVNPPIETLIYSIEILTRLSRDSKFTCLKIYKFESLIPCILNQHLSVKKNDLPLTEQIIRFLIVISCKGVCFARDLIHQKNIMLFISSTLSNINLSENYLGLRLQIQIMQLWIVFTKYGLGLEYFGKLKPVLIQLLTHHLHKTDLIPSTSYLIQTHASSLILLISTAFDKQLNEDLIPHDLIKTAFIKWNSQLINLESWTCGKLQLTASINTCLGSYSKYDFFSNSKNNKNLDYEKEIVLKFLNSKNFDKLSENLSVYSNILSLCQVKKASANLKMVEAACWESPDHVIPLLSTKSPLPFISSFSYLILTFNKPELSHKFLQHTNIVSYLNKLCLNCKNFRLVDNYFTRIETCLIMNLLKIAVSIRHLFVNTKFSSFIYECAVKTLCLFTSEQSEDIEFVLKNVVFNKEFFPTEIFMHNLSLQEEEIQEKEDKNHLSAVFNELNEIFLMYKKVLGLSSLLNSMKDESQLIVACPLKTLIPIDWIYSPIVLLYSEQQQNKQSLPENMQKLNILYCLRWINFYEQHFTKLSELINPTERYCRLSCVFLGKDDLFLDPQINSLLEICFKNVVLKKGFAEELDFEGQIQGLNNFQDLFIQLLEQFQGVSYGNSLFANYILLPLAQKFDVKYRKILWSEYAGVVQVFSIKKEQLLMDFNQFLSQEETDISLLKCYKRCIDNNVARKGFILYEIAKYHVDKYIDKLRKNS